MKRTQTTQEAAEILGCHRVTLQAKLTGANPAPSTMTKSGRRRVDAAELAAWGKANGVEWGRVGRPPTVQESPGIEAARLRKENALASKYELQVARERAQLVPIEDVKREWIEKITTARNKFLTLGATVAPQVQGLPADEVQTILEQRIAEILGELSAAA